MADTIKLNADTFDNVLTMMNSSDKESVIMGLACIEEMDTTTGLVFLLLMRKLANVTDGLWKTNAPKKTNLLRNMGIESGTVLTYKRILELLAERKVSIDDVEFYFSKFGMYLNEMLHQLGYNNVEAVDIKLKIKLHDS